MAGVIIRRRDTEEFDFDGLKITDYTANLAGSSSFAAITVPPGVSHAVSWSKRSDKYYFVTEGNLSFMVDGKDFTLAGGDFLLVKKGDKFKYRNDSEGDVKMILVHTPSFNIDYEVFE